MPQSMSLQYLVRFKNGDLLAMKNDKKKASEPNKWSFSGEEQLDEKDFDEIPDKAAKRLFQRAIIEEVLGGRVERQDELKVIWREIGLPRIASCRLWSFFLEETVGSIQMFGVFQLNIDAPNIRALHQTNAESGKGTIDHEGVWYVVPQTGVHELLTQGWCSASRLHGQHEGAQIYAGDLHDTSRYRLWRLYCALNRELTLT